MANIGKIFENELKDSMPDYVICVRLPDAAQSFGGSMKTRFSRKSPFDFIFWDSENRVIYSIEAKTVKGKSISFERYKGDKQRDIHYHQIEALREWQKYKGVVSGFIISFRQIEKTILLPINEFDTLVECIDKVSFNYADLTENNISFFVIPQNLKRTRYNYDIEKLLQTYRI